MSIDVVVPLMQAVNRDISTDDDQEIWAPDLDQYPEHNLVADELPLCLVYPGQETTTGKKDRKESRRNYICEVFMANRGQGSYGSQLARTGRMHDEFIKVWYARINDDEDEVLDYGTVSGFFVEMDRTRSIVGSGFRGDLEWVPDVFYYGFTIAIPVIVTWT